jgi:DNA-binding CsgD family transcriptional regulator/sugar-specific transcriptional regulator TrmB
VSESRLLEAFGVSTAAESVYLLMLGHPDAGVAELADRLGVPEHVVRDALDELARLSLLRPSWEDPRLLRPVSPDIGLEPLLARQEADLARRQHQIEDGRAALALLLAEQAASRNAARGDVVELVGIDAVRDELERLSRAAAEEVATFAPGGAHTEESLTASKPLDQHLLGRGVRLRTLYLDSVRNDAVTSGYAQWLTEQGGHVRTVPVLPLRMIVVDRRVAVVPMRPDQSRAGAILLRTAGAVCALAALFDQVWHTGVPLGAPLPRDDEGLSPQENAVLSLLANGDTDLVIARKLGVSVRTVRRIAAELMAQLGARSRFQAGVRATQRGWLHRA